MLVKKVYITLILCLLGISSPYAQEFRFEIGVDFRVNSTTIEKGYSKNEEQLERIVSLFKSFRQDTTHTILKVSFCGSASPEGSYQLNKRLAKGRLEALEEVIRREIDIPDSLIARDDSYISWDYLEQKVSNSTLSSKERILEIIRQKPALVEYPGNRYIDSRIVELQKIEEGKIWKDLNSLFFASMRNAYVVFTLCKSDIILQTEEILAEPEDEQVFVEVDLPEIPKPFEPVAVKFEKVLPNRHFYLKSNVLGLGMLMANIAAEMDFAEHWSFALPVYYSAWNYFKSTIKFRTFSVLPEFRYWFKENNDGFFTGAHFGLIYYNFAFDGAFRYQDHNGDTPAIGGGLSAGYRLPISKDNRWKVEFSLGAGIYTINYDKFHNTPQTKDGLLIENIRKTCLGIDQAAVSFSYMFDLKKGGKR